MFWKKISALMAIGAALVSFYIAGINYNFNKTLMVIGFLIGFLFALGLWFTTRRDNEQLKYLELKVSERSKKAIDEEVL